MQPTKPSNGVCSTGWRPHQRRAPQLDAEQLDRLPLYGPVVNFVNHGNFLSSDDLPTYSHDMALASPRSRLANPIYRLLFNNLDVIPIDRDAIDVTACARLRGMDQADSFHHAEGTRSHDGQHSRQPGVVLMALHNGAPVCPLLLMRRSHCGTT